MQLKAAPCHLLEDAHMCVCVSDTHELNDDDRFSADKWRILREMFV